MKKKKIDLGVEEEKGKRGKEGVNIPQFLLEREGFFVQFDFFCLETSFQD